MELHSSTQFLGSSSSKVQVQSLATTNLLLLLQPHPGASPTFQETGIISLACSAAHTPYLSHKQSLCSQLQQALEGARSMWKPPGSSQELKSPLPQAQFAKSQGRWMSCQHGLEVRTGGKRSQRGSDASAEGLFPPRTSCPRLQANTSRDCHYLRRPSQPQCWSSNTGREAACVITGPELLNDSQMKAKVSNPINPLAFDQG